MSHYSIKNVDKSKVYCPDCGEALFWAVIKPAGTKMPCKKTIEEKTNDQFMYN
jgi:ribosomal protein S27AE